MLTLTTDDHPKSRDSGNRSSDAIDHRAVDVAARDWRILVKSAGKRICALAVGIVRRHNRTAVLCAGGQQSVAAGVVRARRPSCGTRSVFSLRLIEHRQLPGPTLLPGAAEADVIASHAKLAVDLRIWIVDCADRRLRHSVAARTALSDAREHHRRRGRPSHKLGVARALGVPGTRAIRPAYRGHSAHFD